MKFHPDTSTSAPFSLRFLNDSDPALSAQSMGVAYSATIFHADFLYINLNNSSRKDAETQSFEMKYFSGMKHFIKEILLFNTFHSTTVSLRLCGFARSFYEWVHYFVPYGTRWLFKHSTSTHILCLRRRLSQEIQLNSEI